MPGSLRVMNPRLFCKPHIEGHKIEILYKRDFKGIGNISFRSMQMSLDLKMIFDWVNREYSKQFWQLNGSKTLIENTYGAILTKPASHSFIGLLNSKPICQVDIYSVSKDELSDHVLAKTNDCGMHFHMAPIIKPIKGLSVTLMQAFLDYYFFFPQAEQMYGEPDSENAKANKLVEKAGFRFIRPITMSYKQANLWVCTHKNFLTAFENH
jgi:Acetyltransferase (GNAT) domain